MGELQGRWHWEHLPRKEAGLGWVAAYLMAPQEGNVIVAEVRIFPQTPGLQNAEDPGWDRNSFWLPIGGLTGRVIRDITSPTDAVRNFLALQQQVHGPEGPVSLDFKWKQVWDRKAGKEVGDFEKRSQRVERRLLVVAYHYVKELEAGVKEVNEVVGERLGRSSSKIRDDVRAARRAGLLTYPPKRGVPGGHLTPKAIALINELGMFRRPRSNEPGTFQELQDKWAAEDAAAREE